MKRLTKYFFEGLIFLVPTLVAVYAIYFVFAKVDGLFRFGVPDLGFFVTIAAITVSGSLHPIC